VSVETPVATIRGWAWPEPGHVTARQAGGAVSLILSFHNSCDGPRNPISNGQERAKQAPNAGEWEALHSYPVGVSYEYDNVAFVPVRRDGFDDAWIRNPKQPRKAVLVIWVTILTARARGRSGEAECRRANREQSELPTA